MIRAESLVYLALILMAPSASHILAAEPLPDVPAQSRLPRTISARSVSMYTRARILVLDATRNEFKLSETQAQKVDDLLREWSAFEDESNRRPFSPPGQNPAGNTNDRGESPKYLERLQEMLTAEQNSHLNRLVLKAGGLRVFIWRDPIAAKVGLSDEQRKQVGAIDRDRSASQDSQMTRFLEILTPEQRGLWDELAGKDFVLPDRARPRGRAVSLEITDIRRPATLLNKEWVRRDLKLTVEQAAKIDALFAALAARQVGLQEQMLAGAQGEAWREEIEELRKSTDEISENLLAAITARQRERLDQLVLQSDGLFVFRIPDVQERLELTPRQMTKMNEFLREFQDFVINRPSDLPSEDEAKWLEASRRKKNQLLKDALLLLSTEQLQTWDELIGPLADQSSDAAIK